MKWNAAIWIQSILDLLVNGWCGITSWGIITDVIYQQLGSVVPWTGQFSRQGVSYTSLCQFLSPTENLICQLKAHAREDYFNFFFLGSAESDDELLDGPPPPLVSRPTAVAAAMRVLEVQEQLEGASHPPAVPPPSQGPPPPPHSSNTGSQLSAQDAALADGEKALLRQMCNVSEVL